jgi:hypothetical protein
VLNVVPIEKGEIEMARQKSALTHARVLELFDYDTATGHLIWMVQKHRTEVGAVAGTITGAGCRYVGVDGESHLAHRLVWFWHKGEWPQLNLGAIDGDRLNTRIENLREETQSETLKKGGLRSTNKTGRKGVAWDADHNEYAVYAYVGGKSVFHSRHKTIEAANEAADEAERGIIPDAETRLAARDRKLAHKRLWAKMVKWSKGCHCWQSIDQFNTDVGEPPTAASRLVATDPKVWMGPGNFFWTEKYRTRGALRQAKKRDGDRDGYRHGHLSRKFGIKHADYVAKLLEQKGVCAICCRPETRVDKERGCIKELAVDHNHETGSIRGLLCFSCNTAIGSMDENVERLIAAVEYLKRWQSIEAGEPSNVVPLNVPLGFGT